jgi:transcriptional antiterminator NusG
MDYQHWYALFVATGHENSVRLQIEDKLSRVTGVRACTFVPKRMMKERKGGVFSIKCRLMFPSYVLIGTEQIEEVYDLVREIGGVLRFLRNDDEFQEVRLEEISKLVYMADANGVIGESKVQLNADDRIEVLSGPLKGFDGWIKRFNRRKGRVAIEILLGMERREIWLGVELVDKVDGVPFDIAQLGLSV